MKLRWFAALCAVVASVALVLAGLQACGAGAVQTQARIANGVALAANDALPLLVRAYRAEGEAAIARVRALGGDRAAADAALDAVRARWLPVWGADANGRPCGLAHRYTSGEAPVPGSCLNGAWPALVRVDDDWATTLERHFDGSPLSLADALRAADGATAAYCAVRAAVPPDAGVNLPPVPGLGCSSTLELPSFGAPPDAPAPVPASDADAPRDAAEPNNPESVPVRAPGAPGA